MANNLASFAIHADDVQRCRRFYEAVFGWRFEPWGPPDFYLVHTGDERKPGIQGLMHKRQQARAAGGANCFECTIAVDDLDAVAKAVAQHGGRIIMEKAPIPTVGVFLEIRGHRGQHPRRDGLRTRAANVGPRQHVTYEQDSSGGGARVVRELPGCQRLIISRH